MFNLSKTKKWTFIVFRDNSRPAMQFKFNRTVVLSIPLLFVCLTLTSIWLMQAYHQKTRQEQQAVIQLDKQEAIIESLQKDLVSLSIQTEDMQEKMKALETLEQEINQLTGSSELDAAASRKKDSASKRENMKLASRTGESTQEFYQNGPVPAAVGGEAYGTSPEDVRALADRTATSLDTLNNQAATMKDRLKATRSNAEAYQEKMRATPSIWPTNSKRITSEFGNRYDPFTRRKSYHSGIDIGAPVNDPVYATADGKVVASGYSPAMGNFITIDHDYGLKTRFLHLNKTLVKQGDHVDKGDEIALVGSTGRSTGPHLHYEVMKNNKLIDPLPFMGSATKK